MAPRRALTTPLAKIQPPTRVRERVPRPRLIDAIDNDSDEHQRVVVVTAPAGYGKTTLLASWVDAHRGDRLSAWVSLDRDDRDPSTLWSTVLSALRLAVPDDEHRFDGLRPDLRPAEHSAFLADLTGRLDGLDRPLAVVVDDAHELAGSPGARELVQFINLVPPSILVVIATRSAFAPQKGQIAGRLTVVRQEALAFTEEETAELLGAAGLSIGRAEELHRVTEGWPQAVAHGIHVLPGAVDEGVSILSLVDRAEVAVYFEQEVMSRLSPSEQRALLTTAVCPVTTPQLVEAMTEDPDGPAIMQRLLTVNPMLRFVTTDSRLRSWYRAHPVFVTFAQHRLSELPSGVRNEWHLRASLWHRDHGDRVVALQLAVDAGLPDLARETLRARGCGLVADGHSHQVLRVIGRSAVGSVHDPFIDLFLALAAADIGQLGRARALIAATSGAALRGDDRVEWDWLKYVVLLTAARNGGAQATLLEPGQEEGSLARVPAELRQSVELARSLMRAQAGWSDEAREQLTDVNQLAASVGRSGVEMASQVGLAIVALTASRVHDALGYATKALEVAHENAGDDAQQWSARAHAIASWASLTLLLTDQARRHADESRLAAAAQSIPRVREESEQAYALAYFEQIGDRRRVARELVDAWPWRSVRSAPAVVVFMGLHSVLFMADFVHEERWGTRLLEATKQLVGDGPDWQTANALHLYRSGRLEAARAAVTSLEADPGTRRPAADVIRWTIEAALDSRAGKDSRARAALVRAFELAAETGFLRQITTVDSAEVAKIIRSGKGRFGRQEEFAAEISAALRGDEQRAVPSPLTPREQELLLELRTLRTVEEIARDMYLSVNTVKTHMRGIYRKLSASTRREAVEKAEALGLI